MTENPQKKKPLVIDSTDSSSLATPSATSESLSSDSPTISSSEETSISKSDEIGLDDRMKDRTLANLLRNRRIF
jgi:hypothetical protein